MKKIVYLLLLFSISLQAQFYQIGGNNISFSTSFAEIEIETVSGNDYSITFEDGTTATGQSGTVLRHPYSSSLNFLEITSITGDIKSVSILENIHIRLDVLTNLTNLEVITDDFAVSGILEGNLSDLPANVLTFYKRESQGVITGDIQHLAGADYIYIYGNQITVTGDIQHLAGADYIYIYGNQITVTGDIQHLAGADYVYFNGNQITVTGDIQHLAGADYVYFIGNQITVTGDIQHLAGANYIYLDGSQITVSGDIQHLAGIYYIRLFGNQITVTGDIQHLAGADFIYIYGNQITVTGDIQHLAGADYIYIYGNQITVTGDIQNLAGVDTIRFIGDQIAVSGDIQHLAGANYVLFIGDQISLSYTSTSWSNAPSNRIQIQELQSGLTQNEVDNLLIDISNAASIPSSGSRIITITANNSAPSAASNSAITFLQNNGYTVNTN